MKHVLLAILFSLSFAERAHEGPPPQIMVYGPVDLSCGGFLATSPEDRRNLEWWMLGYVSGATTELSPRGIKLASTDTNAIKAWVSRYCTEHPLDGWFVVSHRLVEELAKRAIDP